MGGGDGGVVNSCCQCCGWEGKGAWLIVAANAVEGEGAWLIVAASAVEGGKGALLIVAASAVGVMGRGRG